MASPTLSRGLIALATAAFSLSVLALAANAEAPVEQGWWTVSNAGPVAAPAPPDVPADGLLIQGGPASPSALAALVYEVETGTTPDKLTLTIAPESTKTPAATLQLCALTAPSLQVQQGGPMANAPAYDCVRETSGDPSEDGKTYTFDVAALASSETLAVAILPTAPSDRVVFSKPGADSLVTAGSTTIPESDFETTTDPEFSSPDGQSQTFEGSTSGPSTLDGFSSDASLPPLTPGEFSSESAQPPLVADGGAVEAPTVTSGVDPTAATLASSEAAEESHRIATTLLVLGLVAGAGLWTMAGRALPEGTDDAAVA